MAHEGPMLSTGSVEKPKQVVAQSERLSKSVEELNKVANALGESLDAIIRPHAVKGTDEKAATPQEALCAHANFLRSKVRDIDEVIGDLNDLIKRIEI